MRELKSLIFYAIIQWNDNDKTYTIKDDNNNYYVRDDGFRKPSTEYAIGDIAYHASLPISYYLECTTEGTTTTSNITPTSTIGGTVSDGTVVWTVRQNGYGLGGFLRGGIVAYTDNNSIRRTTDDDELKIVAAIDGTTNPYIRMLGKNKNSSTMRGAIQIVPHTESASCTLNLYPNANLTWNNNDLAGSAIVAKSLGANGYVKYASGLIIQWGSQILANANQDYQVNFSLSFSTTTVKITLGGYDCFPVFKIYGKTGFTVYRQSGIGTSNSAVHFIAIGY